MKKFLSLILLLLFFATTCYATSTTITERDKYGRKVGTYTTNGNQPLEISMDKRFQPTPQTAIQLLNATNTDKKPQHTKPTKTVTPQNMTNMAEK